MKLRMAKLKQKYFGVLSKKKKVFNEKRIIKNQKFPFHATFIDYIISTKPWILEKLNQTCKFWFAKYHCFFANDYRLTYYGPFGQQNTTNNGNIDGNFAEANKTVNTSVVLDKIPPLKLLLTHLLHFDTTPHERKQNFQHRISTNLEKIHLCRLKKLSINFQNLSFDEWQFLTSSKTIEIMDLRESFVKYSNNDDEAYVFIEDLLLNLINATEIYILLSPEHFSTETEFRLLDIPFKSKFQQFHLGIIPFTFNFDAFVLFAQKNATKKAEFALYNHESHGTQLYLRLSDKYFGNAKSIFNGNYQNAKIWLTDRRYFNNFSNESGNYETSASLITSF